MIRELLLVFTVKDEGIVGEWGNTQIPKYTGDIIKLLQYCQQKIVNPVHGMVEFELWLISTDESL